MIGNRYFASRHFQSVFPTNASDDGGIAVYGTVSMTRVIQFTKAFTVTGSTAFEKARSIILSFVVTGDLGYSDAMTVGKVFSLSVTGVAGFTKNILIGGVSGALEGFRAIKASISRMI